MTTPTRETQEAKLETVRKLLAKAESTDSAPERRALEERAAELMAVYGLDEEMLAAAGKGARDDVPVDVRFRYSEHYAFNYALRDVLHHIAMYAGCKAVFDGYAKVALIGFEADVRYAEMLFNAAKLQLIAKMDPTWDPARSEDENVAVLYEAGWKWRKIAEVGGFPWPDGGRLIRAYKRQCKREGREPIAVNHKSAYKSTFVASYRDRLITRLGELRKVRENAQQQHEESTGVSSALVLASRVDRVQARMWDLFPELHPDAVARREAEELAEVQRRAEEEMARRAALTDAERAKEDRAEERRQRANDNWWRRQSERVTYDHNAARAGRSAANAVNLGRSEGISSTDRQELA
jgi:hypothetical protein